jgi:hypothetical protein
MVHKHVRGLLNPDIVFGGGGGAIKLFVLKEGWGYYTMHKKKICKYKIFPLFFI